MVDSLPTANSYEKFLLYSGLERTSKAETIRLKEIISLESWFARLLFPKKSFIGY